MAIAVHTLAYTGTEAVQAAPATTQTVAGVTDRDVLHVTVGGTATTVTIVDPGSGFAGGAVGDTSSGALTSTTRAFPLSRKYQHPTTRLVTIDFSQVTGVTACIVRH